MPSIITQIFYPDIIVPGKEAIYFLTLREVVRKAIIDNGGKVDLEYLEAPIQDMTGILDPIKAMEHGVTVTEVGKIWSAQNTPHIRVALEYTPREEKYPETEEFWTNVGEAIKKFLDNSAFVKSGIRTDVWIKPIPNAVFIA